MLSAASKGNRKEYKRSVSYSKLSKYAEKVLAANAFKGIEKSRYVNDSKITDHYAIIPTGQGISARICIGAARRYKKPLPEDFSIFYPPAVYRRINITVQIEQSLSSRLLNAGAGRIFEVAGVPKDGLNSLQAR